MLAWLLKKGQDTERANAETIPNGPSETVDDQNDSADDELPEDDDTIVVASREALKPFLKKTNVAQPPNRRRKVLQCVLIPKAEWSTAVAQNSSPRPLSKLQYTRDGPLNESTNIMYEDADERPAKRQKRTASIRASYAADPHDAEDSNKENAKSAKPVLRNKRLSAALKSNEKEVEPDNNARRHRRRTTNEAHGATKQNTHANEINVLHDEEAHAAHAKESHASERDSEPKDISMADAPEAATPPPTIASQRRKRASAVRQSYISDFYLDDSSGNENEPTKKSRSKPKRHTAEDSESDFGGASDRISEPEDDLDDLEGSEPESEAESEPVSEDDDGLVKKKKSTKMNRSSTRQDSAVPRPSTKASATKMENLMTNGTTKGLALHLPPMSSISDIFADITKKALSLGLNQALEHMGDRPLRVATMCSGTESPLLALRMIEDALKAQSGKPLTVDHLFSAEVVPYKQAYIERNFKPPIIFRDITELTDAVKEEHPMATTAYGARVAVPQQVDVVIAGTSCVDFSRLNNRQKGLTGGGESDKTWHAVLSFCKAFQPPIVLLENVKTAAWDMMLECYEDAGYCTAGAHVDTKDFYIPHTRQRGYMICFHKEKLFAANVKSPGIQWQSLMTSFKRKASSPISSFLLPNDAISRRKVRLDEPSRDVDWSACEIRQMKYRQDNGIGNARPFTNWQESGTISLPETDSVQFIASQVERVKDVIECATLRKALPKNGMYDVRFKTRIWDLSQSIDRNQDSAPFGITGCITPTGLFFISDAGRTLHPRETLTLQGLPLDRISFTTETPTEIQDLAGNAMTASVVGCALAAAIICGHKLIDPSDFSVSEGRKAIRTETKLISEEMKRTSTDTGLELDLAHVARLAEKSSRKCYCEGSHDLAEKAIQHCRDCSHTTCLGCGGNPAHNYSQNIENSVDRLAPSAFEQSLRSKLPLQLCFGDVDIDNLKAKATGKTIEDYFKSLQQAVSGHFSLSHLNRKNVWTVVYRSPNAELHLVIETPSLDFTRMEWRLFAHPDESLASNHPTRNLLEQPVAKCAVSGSLLPKNWQWRVPASEKATITIQPKGSKVASWWSRIGIPAMVDHRIFERLEISVPSNKEHLFERSISGTYRYLPSCGKASDSLFKRIEEDSKQEPLYLFLDPTRTGHPDEDPFVFSSSIERLDYSEVRPLIARFNRSNFPWGPSDKLSEKATKAETSIDFIWTSSSDVKLTAVAVDLKLMSPENALQLADKSSCNEAPLLQACAFSCSSVSELAHGLTRIKPDDVQFFDQKSWLFEAMRRKLTEAGDWQDLQSDGLVESCADCALPKPTLQWKLANDGENIMPYEDPSAAADYERAIKARPDPLVVESITSTQTLEIRFGVNVRSLAHRARARLLTSGEEVTYQWRLTTAGNESNKSSSRNFTMSSTKGEPYTSKLDMSVSLFPNQQMALGWMKRQESGNGVKFALEESEEATIPKLGWSAEVRVETEVHVRGGICADHPGFGKTITSLALIKEQFQRQERQAIVEEIKSDQKGRAEGLIPIAATLIVCPGTLSKQWRSEIAEKLEWKEGVLLIHNVGDLSKHTIADFKAAKIVIVNRSVLGHESYAERLACFAGMPGPATKSGRSFAQWLQYATDQVPEHLQLLESSGIGELKRVVKGKYKTLLQSDKFKASVPSRRLRGKAYVAGQAKKKTTASKAGASADLETETLGKPLLEFFYFNRVIIDEFHQYSGIEYAALKSLKAHKRWGLSATPALDDLYDVAQMAGLIGLSGLRVGSDLRGIMSKRNIKELRKDMTDFERFEAFQRQIPSDSVLNRIYDAAQLFLDTFVRRNIMDFGEIKYSDKLVPVGLDVDHRATYTELSQHLNSLDMKIRKGNKNQSTDRQSRLGAAVSTSDTAEEALSKTAAFFERDQYGSGSVSTGLSAIIERREKEVKRTIPQLHAAIWVANKDEKAALDSWKKTRVIDGTIGDEETIADIKSIFKNLGSTPPEGAEKTKKRKKSDLSDDEDAGDTKAEKSATSKVSNVCNSLLVSRRSLRFTKSIQSLQSARDSDTCDSTSCDHNLKEGSECAVSAFCGHIICRTCYDSLREQHVNMCPAAGCKCAMHTYHLLWTGKMGDLRSHTAYGGKMQATVDLLQRIEKQKDKAILFVQYATQVPEVASALQDASIPTIVVSDAGDAWKQIAAFRESSDKTVLVLNASDETAAGSNLQCANHVIFFSPLLRDTQYGYDATMAQAVGRVRRHGQKKEIFVYRVTALDTIDVDILEHRERRSTAIVQNGAEEIDPPADLMDVDGEATKEKTQLVRENEVFSLRPQSWLVDLQGDGDAETVKLRGKNRVGGWEDFSSLVKFSRAYTENDE